MELHSYAKRRVPNKKWTIEHKRRLVEARIKYDPLFHNKPSNSFLPWMRILYVAKLEDFNVRFVRMQWINVLEKYRLNKNRLNKMQTKDLYNEELNIISQEWEFFQAVHRFMENKSTSLHSYALTKQKNLDKQNVEPNLAQSAAYEVSSNSATEDANNTQEISVPAAITENVVDTCANARNVHEDIKYSVSKDCTDSSINISAQTSDGVIHIKEEIVEDVPPTTTIHDNAQTITNPKRQSKISERDKYYRHKRHFNRRMEQRFDLILNVFGQIVKAEYPSIDVTPLVGVVTTGATMMNKIFSSCSSSSASEEEDNVDINSQSN